MIQPDQPSPFAAARGSANKWRGECIGHFADVEQRLSATLIRARNTPAYAALKPAFPHLVGQKFERLRKLLSLEGPLKANAARTIAQLDAFAVHDGLRTLLSHGALEVGVTESDSRLYIFQVCNFRNNVAATTRTAFTQAEADASRAELKASAQAMVAELMALEKVLPRKSPADTKA